MKAKIGRGTTGKRGIGSGKKSSQTSTSKPAKAPKGIKKSNGDGRLGGNTKKAKY